MIYDMWAYCAVGLNGSSNYKLLLTKNPIFELKTVNKV